MEEESQSHIHVVKDDKEYNTYAIVLDQKIKQVDFDGFNAGEVNEILYFNFAFTDKINSDIIINIQEDLKSKCNIMFDIKNLKNKPWAARYAFKTIKKIKEQLSKNIEFIQIKHTNTPFKIDKTEDLESFLNKLLIKIFISYFIKIILLVAVVIIVIVTITRKKPSSKNHKK